MGESGHPASVRSETRSRRGKSSLVRKVLDKMRWKIIKIEEKKEKVVTVSPFCKGNPT